MSFQNAATYCTFYHGRVLIRFYLYQPVLASILNKSVFCIFYLNCTFLCYTVFSPSVRQMNLFWSLILIYVYLFFLSPSSCRSPSTCRTTSETNVSLTLSHYQDVETIATGESCVSWGCLCDLSKCEALSKTGLLLSLRKTGYILGVYYTAVWMCVILLMCEARTVCALKGWWCVCVFVYAPMWVNTAVNHQPNPISVSSTCLSYVRYLSCCGVSDGLLM